MYIKINITCNDRYSNLLKMLRRRNRDDPYFANIFDFPRISDGLSKMSSRSKGLSNLDKEGVDLVDGEDERRLLPSLLESALRVVVRPRLDGTRERCPDAMLDVGPCVRLRGAQHAE